MAAKSKSNEIAITRIYDASPKEVWDAWIEPDQVAQWWGPRGFTITSYKKDVRPGGIWAYTMHGPDGTNWENKTLYHEVEPEKLLVYDHGGNDDRPPLFRVRVTFTPIGQKTRMEMTMALATPEEAEKTRAFIKEAGGNGTWDRLAEYLDERLHSKKRFVINRSFDTDIETMFAAWSQPERFKEWLAPKGFTMKFIEADVRPGGRSFYSMTSDDGKMTMFGKVHYVELSRPSRMVYTQQFCDQAGNMSRHPMAPLWPETMRTIVEFADEGPEQTRVTVTWEPDAAATTEELAVFVAARAGMTQGWTGSFDKLEALLG